MPIPPSNPLLHLWAVANAEAWFCQGSAIEPAHFWIACLKTADESFAAAMLDHGAPPEECAAQAAESQRLREYLEMDSEATATLRRRLRGRLLRGKPPREPPADGKIPYLHRSESSRRLFELALRKAESRKSAELTPTLLAESLFDMKLASLESV